jgi:hypothetical protein
VVESTSSTNSLDIVSDIAIDVSAFVGTMRDVQDLALSCYRYIDWMWQARERRQPDLARSHTYIRGERGAEIIVPIDAVADSEVGDRIERMWAVANNGRIAITVELGGANGSG